MASQEGISRDQMVAPSTDARLETKYMLETMEQDPELRPLVELFRRAGAQGYLNGPDLLTLFAPKAVPEMDSKDTERLAEALRRQLLGQPFTEVELRNARELRTLAGSEIRIERKGAQTTVNGAAITRADIECRNGVIHVVDGALR